MRRHRSITPFSRILALASLGSVLGVLSPGAAAVEPAELGGLSLPTLYAPECQAIPYEPVDAYQSPGGLRIGKLVLDHPEYAKETRPSCAFQPRVQFRPEGLNRLMLVDNIEVGYETSALAVFEVKKLGETVWYRGQAENSLFWVKGIAAGTSESKTTRYRSYERDLVFGVERVSETCDALGRCQPTTQAFQELVAQAGQERKDTCYANAYDFVAEEGASIEVSPQGRRVYKVRLSSELAVKYAGKLPNELRVPTYDYRGQWTGFFYSRGC